MTDDHANRVTAQQNARELGQLLPRSAASDIAAERLASLEQAAPPAVAGAIAQIEAAFSPPVAPPTGADE